MTIRYSTNWMGPVRLEWFIARGLTKTVTTTLSEDNIRVKYGNCKPGDVVMCQTITENWSGGRIDVYGTGNHYNDELSLPIMHGEDYDRFSDWLNGVETEYVWTLNQLVELYEKTNPKIRWAAEVFRNHVQ